MRAGLASSPVSPVPKRAVRPWEALDTFARMGEGSPVDVRLGLPEEVSGGSSVELLVSETGMNCGRLET